MIVLGASQCSCNTQRVNPNTKLETAVKASQKSSQQASDDIKTLIGDFTKMQQSFHIFRTDISTKIDQTFETLQDSVKTGDVEGDVETTKNSNSALYGIGLVAVVLIFVLIVIWIFARMAKGFIEKYFIK